MSIGRKIAAGITRLLTGGKCQVVEAEWLDDLEHRFSCVLNHVSPMSKTNYTLEAMYAEINQQRVDEIEEAIADSRETYRT